MSRGNRKRRISPYRLSKIITNRECARATDYLVSAIGRMSTEQRLEIKLLLNN